MKQILLIILISFPTLLLAQPPSLVFMPMDGATNVSVSDDLEISSSEALRNTDNSDISTGDLDDLITLEDSEGTDVTFSASMSGNKKDITIDPDGNLNDNTTYTLTIAPVEDSDGNETVTQSITFTTGDFTNPSFTSAKAINNAGSAFVFRVQVSEDATVYYVVDTDNNTPENDEIEDGYIDDGITLAEVSDNIFVNGNTSTDIPISGLDFSPPVGFNVYFYAEDAAGRQSFTTVRRIPLLNSSSITSVEGDRFDLTVSIDEKPVTVYYVVTTTAAPPTSAQIFNGLDDVNGTPVTSGNFSYNPGTTGNNVNHTITGLDDNTTYYVHFYGADGEGNETVAGIETAKTDDTTPPSIVSLSPSDNTTVDFNTNKLIITFDEIVDNIGTPADPSTDNHHVIIKDGTTHAEITRIPREDLDDFGNTTIEIPFSSGTLAPNKMYYVLIGNVVIEDVSAGNNWGGISDPTAWNFSTSGVTVNNTTSEICAGSFQSIANIVINEVAAGDFITSGSIELELDNSTDFVYDISGVTVTFGPAGSTDVSAATLDPKTFSSLTLNYTLTGTSNIDQITISGLKIYASAVASTTITNGNTVSGKWAIGTPVTFATINVGSSVPALPQLETAPETLLYCKNENISTELVSVVDNGGTFKWYKESSLTNFLGDGAEVAVEGVLDIDPAAVGVVKRYVVRIDGCQSAPLEVTFEVAPVPVADAGPATVTLCSGSSVTLGGSPTLTSPSVAGEYQYLWSTNSPDDFINMGSNPTVAPENDSDTTFKYTVKIIDANGCASDIDQPDATVAVAVDSTDETIVYSSPLSTNFTLNSDPIVLDAMPSNNSSYSGNGVYLSSGTYYFDPDLAGTTGSPHAITYTTNLSNSCPVTDVRNFAVSNSSGSIINLANSYCSNEAANPSDVLALGAQWAAALEQDNNKYYRPYGYEFVFYDFQALTNLNTVGPGVVYATAGGGYPDQQHIDPTKLQPYQPGAPYTYVGMRVRQKTENTLLGIPLGTYSYGTPFFWNQQYVNLYIMPALKVRGLSSGQVICDVSTPYLLEANFDAGTFEISRDQTDWFSGPDVGLDNTPPLSGRATLNPHEAFTGDGFGLPQPTTTTDFYIRYTYPVPSTNGSNSAQCKATIIIPFRISPNPSVAWVPFSQTEFCFESGNFHVETNPLTGVTINGYGIFDNGNGTASFDPDAALKAKAFATNTPPYTDFNTPENITISAIRTDVNGCSATINQVVQVRPLYPATFTESDLEVCHEDGPQNIIGGQLNGYYELSHPNVNVTFPQTTINGFHLREYFNDAVAAGADGSISQKFNLTFHTSDPTLGCSNSITKTFMINPPLEMNIVGMTPGMIVCGNGTALPLTGNWENAGTFEISDTSPVSGFVNEAHGLDNTNPGNGIYTPSGAGLSPGSPQKSFYIRYSYLGAGCILPAQTTEELVVNPQPSIAFSSSIPAPGTAYCFEQGTAPTTIALATVADQPSNVTISGFGITDNGGGNAVFNPTSAYQQSSLEANQNPFTDQTVRNIQIVATTTDAQFCKNTTSVSYTVNPLPTATFEPSPLQYCYEDDPVTLSGGQTNVSYQFVYRNTVPANYSPPPIFQATTPFDPGQRFNDAVAKGANALATMQFDVTYTAINSTTGCTNKLAPVTLTVSPKIPVEMAGIDEGDIYCSNTTDKEIVFTPDGGTFTINGTPRTISNGKYLFDPQLFGPAGGTDYTFVYNVITGNDCSNTQEKTIKVLPSPEALFSVDAMCDTALIAYDADPSTNLSTAEYTWTLSGEVKTGQNIQHRFPGVSTYSVQLVVKHPAYMNDPDLACADSLRLDQIVGPYPDIQFSFFNVCEDDKTNFEVITNSIPISTASWSFGDGESTSLGTLSDLIPNLPKTTGTYQKPIHKYDGAADRILVEVVGKTSPDFGGCETSYSREISILKKWSPTASDPSYDMSQLDNGKGFWVVEDNQGNSSWEFNTAAKQRINTSEMAWVTGSTLPYNADDISYVNSPCFDLSSFSRPVVSIKHWTDTEPSDGAVLQYSVDGGENWERLGNVASGLDWYNRLTISSNPGQQTDLSSGWSLSDQIDWATGKHTLDGLPFPRNRVRFRIAFSSFNNRENRDGFAFNNIVIEERNRTILVENFTNADLTLGSTANNNAFEAFRTVNGAFNPSELVKLQYHHASTVASDELNQDNPVDQNARAAFYGVTEPIRAFVDGGSSPLPGTFNFTSGPVIDTYFSLRSLVSSPVNIAIDFEADPSDKLNVKATIKANTIIPKTGRYNVFIAIAERSVSGQVYVLRKFLPDAAGTPLSTFSETDPAQEIIVSYDMRHVTRLANEDFAPIAVIVFVQELETKDVLQTAMREDATPPAGIVTGVETTFDSYIKLYPNPADHTLNISLPAAVTAETPLQVFDSFGRQVFEGVYTPGEYIKTIETKELSSGVYLIQLSTPDGLMRKKAMIVHD